MWALWKFILRRLAKAQGFLDPMVVFSNLQHFSKPSEVWVPVELLRSGAVLQARGLINSQAIQHNLDWIWPFWVERQFNPNDKAFVPRAFSLTHINLTHRNWTAIGLPDFADFPIIDPCGLVTPFFDGWSLDAWIIHERSIFAPSRQVHVGQGLDLDNTFAVLTSAKSEKYALESRAEVKIQGDPCCVITYHAQAAVKSWLMICVRPYNPEGVSFIKDIQRLENQEGWHIEKDKTVLLDKKPEGYLFANYATGDFCQRDCMTPDGKVKSISCLTGMATSGAVYPLEANQPFEVTVKIPLAREKMSFYSQWAEHAKGVCGLKIPDEHMQFLFEAALKTIILHSPGDIYPGPFTYKRFWFRDAAFILQAMAATGLFQDIEKIIDRFPGRQTPLGYFMSQDGEWDSNGQAIWAMKRYLDVSGAAVKKEWAASIYRGAQWIQRKRVCSSKDPVHNGLMPAGFSAEHFGPADFYYWDNFWSVAGLRQAASLARPHDLKMADELQRQADDLFYTVNNSIRKLQDYLLYPGIPASATRRMDAGAIGSLTASYPLQLYASDDRNILDTVKFLMDKYFLHGAFYHEISHSGINIYLTLHVAQVLLRSQNMKFFEIVKTVADLATPTGQWPEAIHPRTKGGCMGDGQHVWACAEWVMMLRNMFVREEHDERKLILCSGIPQEWLNSKETMWFGPAYTSYGEITVTINPREEHIDISWQARWHNNTPVPIVISLPGHEPYQVQGHANSITINREAMAHP